MPDTYTDKQKGNYSQMVCRVLSLHAFPAHLLFLLVSFTRSSSSISSAHISAQLPAQSSSSSLITATTDYSDDERPGESFAPAFHHKVHREEHAMHVSLALPIV